MNGMMKILLLVLMAGVSASNCFAMPWVHLGSDGKTTHYFYKPKTFSVKKGQIVSAWTKKEYNVDAEAMTKNKVALDDYHGSKSVVGFQEFNCSDHKMRTLVGKIYEGKDDTDLERTDWLPISAGTIDEGLLAALCREAAKAPVKNQPK